MSFLWTDKYSPNKSEDIIGNSSNIQRIKQWIEYFKTKNGFENFKNGLVISGSPGIGKTSTALILLKEAGYDVLEYNASQVRSLSIMRDKLQTISNSSNIMMMFKNQKISALILDEIDGCTSNDKGAVSQVIKFIIDQDKISKKKEIKNDKNDKNNKNIKNIVKINQNPVICICNNITPSVKSLLKYSVHIKFNKPTDEDIYQLIVKISAIEKININNVSCRLLVSHCQYDIRRTLNLLQNIKTYFKDRPITIKCIKNIIESFAQKDLDINLFSSVEKINCNYMPCHDLLSCYYKDKTFVPLLVHENFNKNLIKNVKCTKNQKIDLMLKYYNHLIDSNIIDKFIFNNQMWELNDYVGILSCKQANIILNNDNKIRPLVYSTIKTSPVFSKLNYKFYNLKLMNEICKKIKISTSKFHLYTSILYRLLIFNKLDENKYKHYLINLKKCGLTFKNIDKSIKLSYLYTEHSKLYSTKKKKILEKIYKNLEC